MIVTLPTLGAIRDHFPDAFIEVMGYPAHLELIKERYYADIVSRFDQLDIAHLFVRDAEIPRSFRERLCQMEWIISFISDRNRVFSHNLNASTARCIHYDPFPSDDKGIHIVDHFLNSLSSLGINYTNNIPKIFLNDEDNRFGENFIKSNIVDPKKILVAIHPGSGSRQKCWPVTRFVALINWLSRELQAHILVVSGPADQGITERLKAGGSKDIILADQLPLPKLAAVLKRCNLFIGNDSGITHLAAALGVHTIAIFGPTDPRIWGPRGDLVKIIYKEVPCSPCGADTRRGCSVQRCLEYIKTEDVMHEVRCSIFQS
ncbi:Lipopolysaccharide core heptosyltransferase RfaQ [Candidatus Brocadiaceae bacterium B188]|jgi:ADP-heptose:LPS heptosyltransferase|nr:glycosyltransferase family 9 protein [Candidatus Brocadia sapporoensis]MEB2309753.1 glycosyltransferase family 9 protein [Candidatus Brocadiaceae bacterium]OQZ04643.1 MAG: hypothetical protein B6D34_02535 [Candidatus Brocadia sp. UTAMX1]QQR67160.1 MAG: glycosyltransferase family 9 protein [Candidatus Brocadia sp.]RZV58458.1 MAG: glycosyltransferase family 9 protein [Candidatus Brocadia sp. BROELEC01]TWU54183.1 Lipopolysaccharide core heptosyltransferase RfaQ [Candidatus Brocadiaceae bacteri